MKRTIFSIIFFIILCFLCNHTIDYTIGKQIENRSPYSLSFASIGAISLESRLDCWAKIRTSSTESELKQYLQVITSSLNLEYNPELIRLQSSVDAMEIQYDISQNRIAYHLALQTDKQSNETHFIVSAETSDKKTSISSIKAKLDKIIGLEWHDYYLYTGQLDGTLDYSGSKRLAKVILNNLAAKPLESFHEGMSYSATGYSRRLEPSVQPVIGEGQRYNVQIAFYCNPSQDKTYIYIGLPLIVGNY